MTDNEIEVTDNEVDAMDDEKKLYRSDSEVMIAGVCGGLGEYFGVDATVVRLVFVVLAVLMGGLGGLVLYAIMWLVMPEAPATADGVVEPPADLDEAIEAEEWAEEQAADPTQGDDTEIDQS